MPIIKNEWGKKLVLDTGFDLSEQTAMTFTVTRPDGSSFVVNAGANLVVGNVDLTVDSVTYLANKHVLYTIQDGDVPVDGEYTRKLEVTFGATKRLASIEEVFEVEP